MTAHAMVGGRVPYLLHDTQKVALCPLSLTSLHIIAQKDSQRAGRASLLRDLLSYTALPSY